MALADSNSPAEHSRIGLLLALILVPVIFLLSSRPAWAATGDTTIVTFVQEPIDNAHRLASRRFQFPPRTMPVQRVTMVYTIECPPNGCDPWDRVSTVTVARPVPGAAEPELVEIARIVTPSGKGWSWAIDVTDYAGLLRDSITLNNFIQTYTGGGSGFLVTIAFRFVAGTPDLEPYRIENLWVGLPEYGNPGNPVETLLKPIGIRADDGMDFAKIRITTTGHGQGNTDDAATYARKRHDLVVGARTFSHHLWRDDCAETPAGPMLRDWKRSRAGFCPGDVVHPWDNDISDMVTPGGLFTVDYNVEPYENKCRPDYKPCPCNDCSYENVHHIQPFFWVESQIIYYRITPGDPTLAASIEVSETGADGVFRVTPSFPEPSDIRIGVVDLEGNEIFGQVGREVRDQPFTIDLSATPGTYLLKIMARERTFRKKISVKG